MVKGLIPKLKKKLDIFNEKFEKNTGWQNSDKL